MTGLEDLLQSADVFLLLILRVGGFMAAAPVFASRSLPVVARIGLTLLVAMLLVPHVDRPIGHDQTYTLAALAGAAVQEAGIGVLLGFTAALPFFALQLAGQVVGFQMGIGIINVIDPQSETQVSIIGEMQYILAAILYLCLDGHHVLLSALSRSYEILPVGTFSLSGDLFSALVKQGAGLFSIGLRIAAPAMVALMMTTVSLGIIARTVPQMNVFIVGFPLTITVGLLAITLGLPLFAQGVKRLVEEIARDLQLILGSA